MKKLYSITAALFLSNFALASSAAAQGEVAGSESNLLLALSMNYAVPDVFARTDTGEFALDHNEEKFRVSYTRYTILNGETRTDVEEEGFKEVKRKFGNKELLETFLHMGGFFPEGETTIKGWSLKCVSGDGYLETYLVKKGSTPVKVSGVARVLLSPGQPFGKYVSKLTGPRKGFYKKGTVSGSVKSRGTFDFSMVLPHVSSFSCGGLGIVSSKAAFPSVTNAEIGDELPSPVSLMTVKSLGLAGSGSNALGDFSVEGAMSLTSPVLVPDVYAFPDFGND